MKNTHRETEFEQVRTSEQLPEAQLVYRPNRPHNHILYYYRNSLVSLYRRRHCEDFSGYLQFPEDTPMNIFGNDLRNAMEKEFVEDLLQRVLARHCARWRRAEAPAIQTMEDLEEVVGAAR